MLNDDDEWLPILPAQLDGWFLLSAVSETIEIVLWFGLEDVDD